MIARYRSELENHGIATSGWWQEQLDLCLIGIMATFGWEKALGDATELSWWHEQGRRGSGPARHRRRRAGRMRAPVTAVSALNRL